MELVRFPAYTYVDVESNPNTPMTAMQVYKNAGVPFRVACVRIYEDDPRGRLCAVTGWASAASGSPIPAYAVQVEDSSAGAAYLVYGGDWGLRLRPADADAAWEIGAPGQWGETHLVLSSLEDIVRA